MNGLITLNITVNKSRIIDHLNSIVLKAIEIIFRNRCTGI